MSKQNITAIILTKNEELHIERCVKSVSLICRDIIVVDSYSTDRTCELAMALGAQVVQHTYVCQAQQFNWAIDNLSIETEWIWRVDADEYVELQLLSLVSNVLKNIDKKVNGIYVNKKIVFQGKPLMHGGWYPAQQIKIIRKGHGRSENKPMDEHLVITDGETISLNGDQTDENLNNLTWWVEKHNHYADREACNTLSVIYGMGDQSYTVEPRLFGNTLQRRRWFKLKYAHLPLYLRPFLNFFYRYILRLGFLDGNHRWYVLQCFWYRYLVDAKIYELKKKFDFDDEKIKKYLEQNFYNTFNVK